MTPTTTDTVPYGQSLWTTRRAMATWSFCIGLWSTMVFWWYPYSIFVATMGLLIGSLSLAMGWRAGRDRENLALGGVLLCGNTLFMTVLVYRGMQWFFGDLTNPIYP